MNINWYPGHMKVALDKIRASLKTVDLVCEVVDARIPISSRNPIIDTILKDFPRMIILNKADMADPVENQKWIDFFKKQGIKALEFNSLNDRKTDRIYGAAREILKDKFEKREKKDISSNLIKMMVVGIPNVGKSSFINNLSKKKGAKTGNKPGVTKMNQWIKTDSDILLLDTPGVLWPKLDTPDKGMSLAFTGAIKDENLDLENLCLEFIKVINKESKSYLRDRYGVDTDKKALEIMEDIAMKTGAILKGREIDYFRVSNIILDDFRKVRIGRITLEKVDNIKNA
ncbi:MAG: ribosome biogenesis GTPase YlqF [Tissierellia bacterium]|nr:ribosome biogenesis GTPase YlqF [Tissierellia bacterium]